MWPCAIEARPAAAMASSSHVIGFAQVLVTAQGISVGAARIAQSPRRSIATCRRFRRAYAPSDFGKGLRKRRLCDFGVMVGVQPSPQAGRDSDEAAQPQIGVRADGLLARQDLADRLRGALRLAARATRC
jgi:hypothetical protein